MKDATCISLDQDILSRKSTIQIINTHTARHRVQTFAVFAQLGQKFQNHEASEAKKRLLFVDSTTTTTKYFAKRWRSRVLIVTTFSRQRIVKMVVRRRLVVVEIKVSRGGSLMYHNDSFVRMGSAVHHVFLFPKGTRRICPRVFEIHVTC